ncbi:MAG TPA: efflux RND transporter permease subunit [Kofleriaceae bacterium]|jgi:cobalt-zinc-cadmium resistance protein CzcA|nr:efflux RND transporter permease subunit [Kofleriaceae bacterium]
MLERLITASFRKPLIAIVLAIAGAAMGTVWMRELPRDVFPDLSVPVFNIIVQNPAMNADELEMRVAIPFETALSGLPQVRRVRSSSTLGVVQITIEFEPDADHARSRQYVAERMPQVELPPGTEPPLLSGVTGRLNEIFEITVEAKPGVADLMTLRDLAENEINNRLLAVPGVSTVERLGGYLREFQIQMDPDRMTARGVTLDQIMHAARGASVSAAGGFVTQAQMDWTVRATGRAVNVEELRDTVVVMKGGIPVLLGDVADVREAPAVRRGIAHRLAGEVVSCRIVKQFGADTVAVARGIRRALADLRGSLPRGVEIRIVYDQSELVESSLGGVGRAVLIGAALVALVLFALLGNVRAALIVTLTLPLSLALSGVFMRFAGIGINTMTLGGLAIAVGLLVDSSIIVVENVAHRISQRRDGEGRGQALAAAAEVGRPIAFATAVVTAVFLPLFAMTGIEGRMYKPLAGAVIAAVIAALVLALALVPVVAAGLLRPTRAGGHEDVWLVRKLKQAYRPVLDRALRHTALVMIIALAITAPALWIATRLGSDFVPPLDEGAILMQTFLPPEASLEEVDRLNHRVEDVLRAFPEVSEVVRRTGRAERTEDPMPHTLSDVLILLQPDRARTGEALVKQMREAVEKVPGVSTLFTTPLGMRIDEGLGGTPADISVRIFGPDAQTLADLAESAAATIRAIDGMEDVRAEPLVGLPQLTVQVDREAAARIGLTPGDVIEAVQIGLAGQEVSEIWIGQRRFALTVKLSPDFRRDAATLAALMVDGHDGSRIPLGKLTKIEPTFGLGTIKREAGSRRIAVEASVSGRDLGSAVRDVRDALARRLKLPPGYFVDVGGKVERQTRAQQALTLAVGVALLAVFLLLYTALGSLAETAVILATLPSAFVGGIVALLIARESWSVSSLVGLIGLFGIAVQNGLVLVTQTRGLIRDGQAFNEALREACIGRVRPKIMTAATAILGLLPLLVLKLDGTEIERPLAIVMIGGLVTSTVFTLLALPTFYQLVHNLGIRWRAPQEVNS